MNCKTLSIEKFHLLLFIQEISEQTKKYNPHEWVFIVVVPSASYHHHHHQTTRTPLGIQKKEKNVIPELIHCPLFLNFFHFFFSFFDGIVKE